MRSIRRAPWLLVAALMAALVVSACGGTSDSSGGGTGAEAAADASGDGAKLSLVAYSTPKEAYAELIPLFQKTPEGAGVTFTESYDASGAQSRAVEAGLPADVVEFSLEPDMIRLVDTGIVASDWNQNDYDGFVTDSVVVFVVRKGNPKNIKTWDDVIQPGVEVLTPNPFTSGGARWNLMAGYGAQLKQGKTEEEAVAFLGQLLKSTVVQDKSARDALSTFDAGKGDVLLSYENEAIAAQQAGEEVDYVVPDQTILIQNPVASTEDAPEQATAFVKFLYTTEAQKAFGEKGYRPVVADVAAGFDFPAPTDLFTIDDLGGWPDVLDRFFDKDNGIVAQIEKGMGVSTDSG